MCARSSKFSLFDPAKEMAYIQMSRAEKSKGKAAVDLVGSQVLRPCLRALSLQYCAHACFCWPQHAVTNSVRPVPAAACSQTSVAHAVGGQKHDTQLNSCRGCLLHRETFTPLHGVWGDGQHSCKLWLAHLSSLSACDAAMHTSDWRQKLR